MLMMTTAQVPKHLGKVGGESIFEGLHSAINHYREVRAMTLTLTKAHNQFMPSLSEIPHSLCKYGHDQVGLVYTDNVCGDKAELERVFSSLRHNVVPVPPSSLPPVSLPSNWESHILGTSFQVNSRLNILMEDLALKAPTDHIHIAIDMEWSVDHANGIQGRVALVQLAYGTCIYLIPVRTEVVNLVLYRNHNFSSAVNLSL